MTGKFTQKFLDQAEKLNLKNTKAVLDQFVTQAKESVQVLEALQKEGLTRARTAMKIPSADLAKALTNEKVVATLKKMGLATRSEVRDLENKVEELASELRAQLSQVKKEAKKAKGKDDTSDLSA